MQEQEIQQQEIVINYNNSELELLFQKYFKTLEEQEKEKQKIEEEKQKIEEQEQQEIEDNTSSYLETQKELIEEVRELKEFQQYGNNLGYFSITIILLILASSLMYKFLKIFL